MRRSASRPATRWISRLATLFPATKAGPELPPSSACRPLSRRSPPRCFLWVLLATPRPRDLPARPLAPGVRQVVLGCPDADLLGRVLTFRAKLEALLRDQPFEIIHFRSVFEGYPLARHKDALGARLV